MKSEPNQPVHLEALNPEALNPEALNPETLNLAAFDLTPGPAAIHEANRLRMQQYIRSLPPEERYPKLVEPPIRRKTVPNNTRWLNPVRIVNR